MIFALANVAPLRLRIQRTFAGDVGELAAVVAPPRLPDSLPGPERAALQLLVLCDASDKRGLHALIAGLCVELERFSFGQRPESWHFYCGLWRMR